MLSRAYGTLCPECRRPLLPGQRLHLDHIVPTSLGGSDHPGNLQVTHAACNMRKGDKTPHRAYAAWM
jgi:5-methylcytosine-specific restriction endonuclease McrA